MKSLDSEFTVQCFAETLNALQESIKQCTLEADAENTEDCEVIMASIDNAKESLKKFENFDACKPQERARILADICLIEKYCAEFFATEVDEDEMDMDEEDEITDLDEEELEWDEEDGENEEDEEDQE